LQVWLLVLPLALAVPRSVWLEPQPVGLMPVAVRSAAPTGWWSKKIGYLKIFACGFRQAVLLSYPRPPGEGQEKHVAG
jgi:hypothetical protein